MFLLEDVHIGAAMIVDNDIEAFLTMRKQALGDITISSSKWEFNISSVNDGASTEHAKGQISCRIRNEHSGLKILPPTDMACAQSIHENRWYDEITTSKGLIFGTSFRRLSEIALEAQQRRASAKINLEISPNMTRMKFESDYIVHPTVLDTCLQLSVLAAGNSESDQAFVPVSIDKLEILEKRGNDTHGVLESHGHYVGFKGLYGNAQLLSSTGEVVIGLQGLRFVGVPAGGERVPSRKREAFWRLVWDDDYDAVTKENEELYFPSEKYWPKQYDYPRRRRVYLTQMVIRQFSQKYPHLMTAEPLNTENKHFIEWAHWLLDETKRDYPTIYNMMPDEREIEIEKERPLAPSGTEWLWALYENLHRIISGDISVLDISTSNELLGKFYGTQLIYDKFERAVELMAFKNPNTKILGIGAGTGSATELVLKRLTLGGTKRYSTYFYTDISTSFFVHASAKFAQHENIKYKLYDMEKEPEEQDYEPASFDLVIASYTVHVTANITNTLKTIRKLLIQHSGKLVLTYDDEDRIPYIPSPSKPKLCSDAAYLIVGGLRGIGSYLSKWMTRHGVKHLVFLARSPIEGESQDAVNLRSFNRT